MNATGGIQIDGNISGTKAGSSLILLAGTAGVTQNAASTINIGTLAVTAATAVSMTGTNAIGTIAGTVSTNGAAFAVNNTGHTLIVGTAGGLNGITTSNGNVTLKTATSGDIVLNQGIAAGSGTVAISAAGAITQNSGANITAAALGVVASGGNAQLAFDNKVGTVAASITSGGNYFQFNNTASNAVVGTVGTIVGITTNGGEVALSTTTSGNLDINATIGAGAGFVSLNAVGTIGQTAVISATGLEVTGQNGNVTLNAGNAVGTLAVSMTNAGDAFSFNNTATNLIVGHVNNFDGIATNNGNVTLKTTTSGNIDFNKSVGLGTGTLAIVSAGTVGQTAAITAAALAATGSNGSITLNAGNVVGTVAASLTKAGDAFSFNNTATNLIAGTAGGVTGISTNNGNVSLQTTTSGNIDINNTVGAGTGTLAIVSAGTVGQTATIAAAALAATGSNGSITLTQANAVGTVAASLTHAGDAFAFNNTATSLKIDTVAGVTGITTNNGTVSLKTTTSGDITLNQNVAAGTSNVILTSAGTIGQTGGSVTATGLALTAPNGASLLGANKVGTIAGTIATSGSAFAFNNSSNSLTVDTVGGVTGVATNNGNITLKTTTSGDLTLNQIVNAGTATVTFGVAGGISQNASGILTAGTMTGSVGGLLLLTQTNAVDVLGAFNAAYWDLVDGTAMKIAGAVTISNQFLLSDYHDITVASTGSITGGAVSLYALGNITLAASSLLGQTGVTVDLSAVGVTQDQHGTIVGSTLRSAFGIGSGGASLLGTANAIGTIANMAIGAAGFTLVNTGSVKIANLTGATDISVKSDTIAVTGSATATTSVSLVAGAGGIALNTGHILSAPTIDLSATGGGITQVATGGTVNASTSLQSTSGVTGTVSLLGTTNTIAAIGGFTLASGDFLLQNTAPLTVSGDIHAASGNVALLQAAGQGVTISGSLTPTGTASVQSDTLTFNAGATITGKAFEWAPTSNTAITIGGGASNIPSLTQVGVTQLIRIGAVRGLSPTATSITLGSKLSPAASIALALESQGNIADGGFALTNISTLSGQVSNAGSVVLTNAGNTIAALGNFAVNGGDFKMATNGTLTVVGTVTAGSVLTTPNPANTQTIKLKTTGGDIVLGVASGAAGVLNAGTIILNSGGTITQPNGSLIANLFSAGAVGDLILSNASNQVTAFGGLTATGGDVVLVVKPSAILTGLYSGNNLFFEAATTGGTLQLGSLAAGATFQATAAANPRITFVADNVTESGIGTNAITATGGSVEVAGFGANITIGGAGTPNIDNTFLGLVAASGATTAVFGQYTDAPNGGTIATMTGKLTVAGSIGANNIVLSGGTVAIAGFVNAGTVLTLGATTGGITESGSITAPTLVSQGTIVGGATLTGTNTVASLGNVAVSGGSFSLTDTGSLTVVGTVAGPNVTLNAGTLEIDGFVNTATILALGASAGGINEGVTGSINAGTLTSIGTVTGNASLTATNTIGVLGTFASDTGITLATTGSLSVTGSVSAPAIALSAGTIGIGGILNGSSTVALAASAGGINESGTIVAGTLISTGVVVGGATLTGSNTIATLANFSVSGGDFSLNDTGLLQVAGTEIAPNVSLSAGTLQLAAGSFLNVTGTVALGASAGGISQNAAATISAATLIGNGSVTGGVTLTGSNTIAALGSFTVSSGNFTLTNTGSLNVTGAVTAPNIVLSADTLGIASTGFLNAGAILTLEITAGGITESGSIAAATLTSIGTIAGDAVLNGSNTIATMGSFAVAGTLTLDDTIALTIAGPTIAGSVTATSAIFGVPSLTIATGEVLNAGSVTIATSAGGVTETGTGQIVTNSLSIATTGAGDVSLTNANNQILASNGITVASGNLILVDDPTLTLTNTFSAKNLFFQVTQAGDTIALGTGATAATLTAGSGNRISIVADQLTAIASSAIKAPTGNVEIAPFSSTVAISLGGASGLAVNSALLGAITAGTLTLGRYTDVTNANTPTTTAANISVDAAVNLSSIGTLNLLTLGSVTESAGSLTVGTLIGNAVSGMTLGLTGNNIATLGSFSVTAGDFTLSDTGNTGNLAVNGPVTAGNITIANANTGTISVAGSLGATTGVTLAAGSGGIRLNTGEILSGPTVDLSATGGGVTQVSTGSIVASTVLQSTSGVNGTVSFTAAGNTIASVGGFAVTGGDFTLTGTGNLGVSGALTATNIVLNSSTIAVTGSIGATTGLTLAAGSGGIQLNTGEILSGATVDLSATGGGVTQVSTGTILASTILQSGSGVTGTVSLNGSGNTIASLGSFTVTSGDFGLTDTGKLAVAGPLTAANIVLNSSTIAVTGSIGATTGLTLAAGSGGIQLNTGEILSGATVDLSATGGGVTQVSTGTILASTILRSGSGVTGTVSLNGSGNTIASLGSFAVTSGDFNLTDTGNLAVAGRLTATNIALNSPTITVTGSVGATTGLTLAAGAGGIALNTGEILSGATVDLSATGGGITQVSTGTIVASTVLRSTAGVTGTVNLAGTANNAAGLGSFAVTSGNFTLVDNGNAGQLSVAGPVTAGIVTIDNANTGTIAVTGSIGATTGVTLASGSGGIRIGTGGVLNGPTVDVSATGGGATESGTGSIVASTVLQSTAGVTGTVTLNGTGNTIASVGSFAVASGDFNLTDTGNLGVAGRLTATNIALNSPTITVTGSVGATTGLTLAAGAGGLALNAGEILSGATVDLSATGGGIAQASTGTIVASTVLRSTAGVTGTVNLAGTANNVAALGGFAVTGGTFTLVDNGNAGLLRVTGPVTAATVTIDNANTGSISVTGSIGTTTGLTLASGSGGIQIGSGGVLSGPTVDVSTTGGGVTESGTGAILASTVLQSTAGVSGTTSLTSATNTIAFVGSFAVTGGNFALVDTGNLTVTGPLTAANVAIQTLNAGIIAVAGSIGATTSLALASGSGGIQLGAASVLSASVVDLSATGGGVTQAAGGTIVAGTVASSNGITGSAMLTGSANRIGAIANVAVAGNLTVVDSQALVLSGKIDVGNAGTVSLTTLAGGVTQASSGTLIAGTFTSGGIAGAVSLAGSANQIGTLSNVSSVGQLTVVDSIALTLAGMIASPGGTVDLTDTGGGITQAGGTLLAATLTSSGNIAGTLTLNAPTNQIGTISGLTATGLLLNNAIGLTLANVVSVGQNGTADFTVAGGLNQATSGVLIAGTLNSAGGLGATSALLGAGNQIRSVSSLVVVSGSLSLNDSVNLTVNANGLLKAHQITVTDTGNAVTLANGAGIVTDGITRPSGTLLPSDLPTASKNTNGGAYFTVGTFQQTGVLNASNLNGSANILRIDSMGTIKFDPTNGLNGPNTWLILSLGSSANTSGAINVKALDVNYTGVIGGASLSGSINGVTGQAAASAANIEPAADTNFKFNACAIHSVNCVLLTTQGVPQIAPSSEIVFSIPFISNTDNDTDVVVSLVGDSSDTQPAQTGSDNSDTNNPTPASSQATPALTTQSQPNPSLQGGRGNPFGGSVVGTPTGSSGDGVFDD